MNNFFNQQGYVYNNGVQSPQQRVKLSPKLLDANKIAEIRKRNMGVDFDLTITPEELDNALCEHMNESGQFEVTPFIKNGINYNKCNICGAIWEADISPEVLRNACAIIIDWMQDAKMKWVSKQPQTAAEIFKLIPFLGRIPALDKQIRTAWNNLFVQSENQNNIRGYNNGSNLSNIFGMLLSGGWGQQQGNVGGNMNFGWGNQQPQQGQYNTDPWGNPIGGQQQPQPVNNNGFGVPSAGYSDPNVSGMVNNLGQAPAPSNEVVTNKTWNV